MKLLRGGRVEERVAEAVSGGFDQFRCVAEGIEGIDAIGCPDRDDGISLAAGLLRVHVVRGGGDPLGVEERPLEDVEEGVVLPTDFEDEFLVGLRYHSQFHTSDTPDQLLRVPTGGWHYITAWPFYRGVMQAVPGLDSLLWPAAILGAVLLSGAIALWLTRDGYAPVRAMRSRFIYGIPWGSIIVLGVVLLVYLLVQDGWRDPTSPVVLPYVNWSYLYPTGVILAPLSHGSLGHIIANLTTALVLAPLAEYTYGHYPQEDPWRLDWSFHDRPVVRAAVIFPGVVLGVGLLTSLFAWGPVIGFSGVVFAFAGFTVVKYPIITIVAIVARSAIARVGEALFNPVVEATVRETVSQPGWVGTSFQGHALGFLIGVIIGVVVLHRRRDDAPAPPLRLWFGLTAIGLTMSLWAIWFSAGSERYVLYQGLGVALIFVGAALVVLAASASDRTIKAGVTRRQLAVMLVLLPLLIIAMAAIPMNVLEVTDHERPDGAVTVGDYDVFYGDGVEARLRPVIGLFDDDSPGTASGVIVVSESRHVWTTAASSSNLERSGSATVRLGGIGWADTVQVEREGWTPVGNDTVYRVTIDDGNAVTTSYTASERTADPTIAGYTIGVGTDEEQFVLIVTDPAGEREAVDVPDENESATVGDLTIERVDDELVAVAGETRVMVVERE